jgi:hypothetical protein
MESGVDKGNMLESGEILGVSMKIQVEVSSPPLKFGFGLMTYVRHSRALNEHVPPLLKFGFGLIVWVERIRFPISWAQHYPKL